MLQRSRAVNVDPPEHAKEGGDGMAEPVSGIRITRKAFLASFLVLLCLMLAAGVLTRVIPSGSFERIQASAGRQVIPGSYSATAKASYPVWRWLTAPVEVLGSQDGIQAIVIILFILSVGGAFAILDKAKCLQEVVAIIARKFRTRRYILLALVTLFFMGIGAMLGIFEETIPLVPLAIALASSLGWDLYVGLGMSILATGFGFSAAIANPFSIGTAQKLSGLPLFSGAGFRVIVFFTIYLLFYTWLALTARKAEKKSARLDLLPQPEIPETAGSNKGVKFFAISIITLIVVLLFISITGTFADYSMPLIALVFLGAGFGSGLASGLRPRQCLASFLSGVSGILPGVLLILMAMAVKHIILTGGIMDTILYEAAKAIEGSSVYAAAAGMYGITLGMNFFIGSATAKAFLLMPLLAPLADLVGLTRQVAVQAFAFGDGFSNMIYPTNAVLIISLGVAGVSWISWFRKTWLLQAITLAITLGLLLLGVATGF